MRFFTWFSFQATILRHLQRQKKHVPLRKDLPAAVTDKVGESEAVREVKEVKQVNSVAAPSCQCKGEALRIHVQVMNGVASNFVFVRSQCTVEHVVDRLSRAMNIPS